MKTKSKKALVSLLFISLTMSSCGTGDNVEGQGQGFNFMKRNQQDGQSATINKGDVSDTKPFTQYGFQRNTNQTATQDGGIPGYSVYDRSLLAESISEMAAILQDVNDVGVLVTDQHVLIVYDSPSPDREAVADQVKQTAMSVVPAYYDVYVADDISLIDEIERFKGQSSRDQTHLKTLHQTIDALEEYPQGQSVDDERNQNQDFEQNRSSNMNN